MVLSKRLKEYEAFIIQNAEKYKGSSDYLGATISFVKDLLVTDQDRGDMVYRYEHSLRAAAIGKEIANGEGWDEEPLMMACLLHDVGYYVSFKNEQFQLHHEYSAEIAQFFLRVIGYDSELSEHIVKAITVHAVSWKAIEDERLEGLSPFELSVRDCDDIDRFDWYRVLEDFSRSFGEHTGAEIIERCYKELETTEIMKTRICGSKTAKKLWNEKYENRKQLCMNLLNQMKSSYEIEQKIFDKR